MKHLIFMFLMAVSTSTATANSEHSEQPSLLDAEAICRVRFDHPAFKEPCEELARAVEKANTERHQMRRAADLATVRLVLEALRAK